MKTFTYLFYNYLYKPVLQLYLRSDSKVRYDGFELKVLRGVFHPKLFFSSTYLYSFLNKQTLSALQFLEIGAGSGILSLLAQRKGAFVTAVDLDPKAVENTSLNFKINFGNDYKARIIQSDVFENLPAQTYDVIVINPPYYFKKVETNVQMAWYCGENGEYFKKLFSGLAKFMHANTKVFMILEEKCELERIRSIADESGIELRLIEEKLIKWEKNYIYQLVSVGEMLGNEKIN